MSAYPDLPGPKRRALARDAVIVILLVAFAWAGLRVYHDVDQLSSLGAGVSDAGLSVKSAFSSAASAANSIPLAGSAIAGVLRGASNATGGNVAALGQAGAHSAHHLALVLGLLSWAMPSVLLLVLVVPGRLNEMRRLHDARLASRTQDAERRRLMALRALLTLPDAALFAHTPDPGGDLLAGRYDGLVAAVLEADGVKAPATHPAANRG